VNWWNPRFEDSSIGPYVLKAVNEHKFSEGSLAVYFQERMAKALKVEHAVALNSGSSALAVGMLALGVKPGDEVILPDRTWIGTAHAVKLIGAVPVLVDVQEDRPLMDIRAVEKAITDKTKVIIPVHLNGFAVDMEILLPLARHKGIKVLEDACQALFSRRHGQHLGTVGDIGCYSLSWSKLICAGQGGIAVTNDPELFEKMRKIRHHGVDNAYDSSWGQFGFNFRWTDIQAALAVPQLGVVDRDIARLKENHARYVEADIGVIPTESGEEVPLYTSCLSKRRDELVKFLGDRDIGCRVLWPSIHTSPAVGSDEKFPNSDRFAQEEFYLPSGHALASEDVDSVISAVREFQG